MTKEIKRVESQKDIALKAIRNIMNIEDLNEIVEEVKHHIPRIERESVRNFRIGQEIEYNLSGHVLKGKVRGHNEDRVECLMFTRHLNLAGGGQSRIMCIRPENLKKIFRGGVRG